MSYQLYEPILNPIIVVDGEACIQYLNPSAVRWLALPRDTIFIGQPYTNFVQFEDVQSLHNLRDLDAFGFNSYLPTTFKLPSGYEGTAKIAVQKIPVGDEIYQFAILIHDAVYSEALYAEEITSMAGFRPSAATNETIQHYSQATAKEEAQQRVVIDENTVRVNVLNQTIAQIECRVILTVLNPRVAPTTFAQRLSDSWMDVLVQANGFQPGLECTIEVPDTPHIRAFSVRGVVETAKTETASTEKVRVKFTNVSPSAKRIIDEYIRKFGISL